MPKKFTMPRLTGILEGQRVRGFWVVWRHRDKTLRMPCTGCDAYNGYEAIAIMKNLKEQGHESRAVTRGVNAPDYIDLEKMEQLFPANEQPEFALGYDVRQITKNRGTIEMQINKAHSCQVSEAKEAQNEASCSQVAH
jgi:hypothetical protein